MNEAVSPGRKVAAEHLPSASRKRWTGWLLLIPGGPRSMAELRDLGAAVAYRFDGEWENALAYFNKSHERLANEARGLLTFDGLVLNALGAVYRETNRIPASLVLAASVCAVIAAGMLLISQFSLSFGDLSNYRSAEREFPSSVTRVVITAKSNAVAGLFSLVAMLCLLTAFGLVVLRNHLH